ncbi:TPA: phage tail protein, partial [Streptococcus suis]|nr:phage tail protein [Streptococcus suis]
KSLIRTVDNTNIYNAVRPTGKAENGDIVTIGGMEAWSVNNEYGEREFYQQGELLYAPLSMQMFPSAFTSGTTADQWIRKDITVDSADKKVIRATAYRELKKHAYPDVSYEVEGFIDRGIGDTVFVYDDGFVPTLLLRMRVVEQEISSTNPSSNRTRFANFKTLDNLLPDDLQKRIDELFEASQPYLIKLATNNGVVFKNQEGETVITPRLYKGGQPSVSSVVWSWTLGDVTTTGVNFRVSGYDVKETSNLVVSAYVDNVLVASTEVTLTNLAEPILMTIKTSNGNLFKNNLINTVLTATLWRGGKEIDTDGSQFSYIWTKTDADGVADTAWNQAHTYSSKSITITQQDVFRRAQFECAVEPI